MGHRENCDEMSSGTRSEVVTPTFRAHKFSRFLHASVKHRERKSGSRKVEERTGVIQALVARKKNSGRHGNRARLKKHIERACEPCAEGTSTM